MNTNNIIERRSAIFWRKHPIMHSLVGTLSLAFMCMSSMIDTLLIFCILGSLLTYTPFSLGVIPITIILTIMCFTFAASCVEFNLIVPDSNNNGTNN